MAGNQTQVNAARIHCRKVAMCEQCRHAARLKSGNPRTALWLMGGPAQLRPSDPSPHWAVEPRIGVGRQAPMHDFIKLLTTGSGAPAVSANLPVTSRFG